MLPRILIADDSALLRTALRGLFSDMGDYEIIEAETGTEAVAKAEASIPSVIILDFAMPEMDGLSATRVLRNRLPEIPIVMYTMHYTEQLSEAAQSAGVRKLISKSETDSLVAAIQEVLTPPAAAKPAPATAMAATVEDLAFEMPPARTGTQ
jgi:DNA-binding NarL/FixJ family response regulator